ncbi:hypothetical protein HRG_012578 [Hirsutella rhossiliensis]
MYPCHAPLIFAFVPHQLHKLVLTVQREIMLRYARGKMGNLSFFLGGKAESDDDKWQPDMGAVRATIQFALATKRFSMDRRGTMY